MDGLTSKEINIALLSLSGLVLVLGLLSGFLKKRLYISEPMVTLVAGVLLSPAVFGLLNLTHWGKPEITRFTVLGSYVSRCGDCSYRPGDCHLDSYG